jgi:hypothetical protein
VSSLLRLAPPRMWLSFDFTAGVEFNAKMPP